MVGAPNVTKEAGIPDWGGRLYLRIQDAMNKAAIATASAITAGSVAMAAKLTTARTITITGDMAWSVIFDGSANVTAAGTLATVNANVGTFGSSSAVPVVTVNAKGQVTAVTTSALGTAATQNTGTSGATVPLLNGTNTWSGAQTVSNPVTATSFKVSTNQVVGARATGWGAASGTLSRSAYAAYAGQTYTGSYVQATAQATDNAIKLLSQTVAALITDLTSHGLIGT